MARRVREDVNHDEELLTPEHLEWLVNARTRNQTSALKLFRLFKAHPRAVKDMELAQRAQRLLDAGFSLWRAAFLADRTGRRAAVIKHAEGFLERMIADNSIGYPQDRSSREWTFGYYMRNARGALTALPDDWKDVQRALHERASVDDGSTAPQRRWDRHQEAFEKAVLAFGKELKKKDANLLEL